MQSHLPCRTLQLAADVLVATRTVEVRGSQPDTFDASVLIRTVHALAERAGAADHRLFVAMVDDRGDALVHEMDRTGHRVGLSRVPSGHVPFAPVETWPDRMLLVTIIGESQSEAIVRVENFEHRARQGWRMDGPAMVNTSTNGTSAGYAHMGVELTDLVARPIRNVEDGEPDGLAADGSHVFIDPNHGEVLAIVRAAELAGETVTLSSAALPGLHLLRRAGATVYELVDDAEMGAELVDVADRGGTVVSAKLSGTSMGSRYAAVRHVGHSIDGAEPSCPAICKSTYRVVEGVPKIDLTLADHGEILQAWGPSPVLR